MAGTLGFLCYRSSIWNFVDVIYYPLAAVGVLLLFASNSTQRELFELDQLLDKHKTQIQEIDSKIPDLETMRNGELIEASFHLVAAISDFNTGCSKTSRFDPRCIVAGRVDNSISAFINATKVKYSSPELRLLGACSAADRLLEDMLAKGELSSLIGDELIAQYRTVLGKNYQPLDYLSVISEAEAFKQRAIGRYARMRAFDQASLGGGARLHNAVLANNYESKKLILNMHKSEIDFGKTLLQRLYPCFVFPKKNYETFAQWTNTRLNVQRDITQIARDRIRLQESSEVDPFLLWVNLNLWPMILVVALALKFAKGTAVMRFATAAFNRRHSTRRLQDQD